MKPKPKFKKQFSQAERDWFKRLADSVREIRLKATQKHLKGTNAVEPLHRH